MKRTATYTITWTIDDDGTTTLKRVNDGFNGFELMGILEIIQKEIIQQCTGKIQPDFIERQIVVDPKPKIFVGALVKIELPDIAGEYIWVIISSINGDKLKGVVNNPFDVKRLKFSRVNFEVKNILKD